MFSSGLPVTDRAYGPFDVKRCSWIRVSILPNVTLKLEDG